MSRSAGVGLRLKMRISLQQAQQPIAIEPGASSCAVYRYPIGKAGGAANRATAELKLLQHAELESRLLAHPLRTPRWRPYELDPNVIDAGDGPDRRFDLTWHARGDRTSGCRQ